MLRSIQRRMKAFASTVMRSLRAAGRALGWSTLGGKRFRNDLEILDLLGTNARLGSPIDAIATDVSVVPWVLKRRRVVDGKTVFEEVGRVGEGGRQGDRLLNLLNAPTGRLNWSSWLYVLTVFRLAIGYGPIRLHLAPDGLPESLQPVSPADVMDRYPRVTADGLAEWSIMVDGKPENVPLQQLLWPFRVDPKDPGGPGLGKARGVEDEVAADEAMVKFNAMYFQNGAILGSVVNIPNADLEVLEKEWSQERRGLSNAHRPLLTNSEQPIQVANAAPAMKDLAMGEGRRLGRDFILQAFHVSQVRVGVLENSTRAMIEGGDFHQQKYCTLPELVYWREFLNEHLVSRFGEDYYLDFVNPVRETAEFRRQLAETGVRGGWVTVNEARAMHDIAEIPGGDMLLIPVNNVIMLDVSRGISVPDIATQMRLNTAQGQERPTKAVDKLNAAMQQVLIEIGAFREPEANS